MTREQRVRLETRAPRGPHLVHARTGVAPGGALTAVGEGGQQGLRQQRREHGGTSSARTVSRLGAPLVCTVQPTHDGPSVIGPAMGSLLSAVGDPVPVTLRAVGPDGAARVLDPVHGRPQAAHDPRRDDAFFGMEREHGRRPAFWSYATNSMLVRWAP